MASDPQDESTRSLTAIHQERAEEALPGLTILSHPAPDRVGEECVLTELLWGAEAVLSRNEPRFSLTSGDATQPLADPYLSRQKIRFLPTDDGDVRIEAPTTVRLRIDDEPAENAELTRADLDRGVILELGERVALAFHFVAAPGKRPAPVGLVGESRAMLDLREQIHRLAEFDYPVLLRGESGVGKELVAGALHRLGRRAGKPMVSLNMAALPPDLASAELFGHRKGAFTGAMESRPGAFRQAHSGTLFLDEVGDTPADVQALLLRALETQTVRPLGGKSAVPVDIRLVAATDSDLESAIERGDLKGSFYHRLANCELWIPPLRRRREDIGRLFFHFLHLEMEELRRSRRLDAETQPPFVPARVMARLALYPWPGNVRELRNVVRQMMVADLGRGELRLPTKIHDAVTARRDVEPPPAEESPSRRHHATLTSDELRQALRKHRWNLQRTADDLKIARPTLYRLIESSPAIRTAKDLSRDEIESAIRASHGDMATLVEILEVSKKALRQRMRELGITEK